MAVDCRLRFGARPSSRIKRVLRDVSVTVYADFYDPTTGGLVDVSGVACRVWVPGGALLSPALTPTEVSEGVWSVNITPEYSSATQPYRVEMSCSSPDSAAATIEFYSVASEPDESTPPEGAGVTSVNGQTGAVNVTLDDLEWTPTGTGAVARTASVEFSSRAPLPEHFGAVGDGVTNDATAWGKWLDAAVAAGVKVVAMGRGKYNLGSSGLIAPEGMTIKGEYYPGGVKLSQDFTGIPSSIIHDGTLPVRTRLNARIEGVAVIGQHLYSTGAINTAAKILATRHAWTGTGIQIGNNQTGLQQENGTDGWVDSCLVVGFDRCIASLKASRSHITNCIAEGRDAFYINGSYDFGWIEHCGAPMICSGSATFTSRYFNVTGAADNGSGAIRLTVSPSHSSLAMTDMATGYYCRVAYVGGVPNATGIWQVTVVDDTHLDLIGSTWGGAYTSGGQCHPQINWSRGTAFSIIDTDGYSCVGLQSNNYTQSHYSEQAVAAYAACNSESYNFPMPLVNVGWRIGTGDSKLTWVGGSLGAATNKIYCTSRGRISITGAYIPSSGSAGATIEHHAGRLFITGCAIAGRANLGDGIQKFTLSGGSSTSVAMSGSALALSKFTMDGSSEGGNGQWRVRGTDIELWARDVASGIEKNVMDATFDRIRFLNDGELWGGRGSPEGLIAARRGSFYLNGTATETTALAVKLTSSSTATGWAWVNVTPIPPVLDADVAGLIEYASAGEAIVAGGVLHEDAVFVRTHGSGDVATNADAASVWSEVAANTPRFYGPDRRLVIEGLPVVNEVGNARGIGAADETAPTNWSVTFPAGLVANWQEDSVDGMPGLRFTLTGTTTASAAIAINSAGNSVALGAAPAALGETWAGSFFAQVLADDPAITTLTGGFQALTSTGGSAGGSTPSWHSTRLEFLQRSGVPTELSVANTAAIRTRIVTNTIASGVDVAWSVFLAYLHLAESASVDLPMLPAPGTSGTGSHDGETLEIAASDISVGTDGECSVYMACVTRRASLAGTDQVLVRIGDADDCARAIIAAGSNTLQMQRVIGGTPGTAVTLGTVTPLEAFGFVMSLAADGTLSGALAEAGETLATQAGTAISGVTDVYVGVSSVIEVRTLSINAGVPA